MSKVIIVPDVHGRTFWRLAKEKINEIDRVVFLGDYLDPYPVEDISPEKAIEELKKIINFKKEFSEKVILLIGNHDYHYMNLLKEIFPCSRYDFKNAQKIEQIFNDNQELFQVLYKEGKYLFSHAGVVEEWMKITCGCEDLDTLLKEQHLMYNHLWYMSRLRGGYGFYGSCIWSDIREFENTFPGVFQIFGHTQLAKEFFGPSPGIEETFACLDCRECFILNTEEQTIEKL